MYLKNKSLQRECALFGVNVNFVKYKFFKYYNNVTHLNAPTRCPELLRLEKESRYFEGTCWDLMRKNGELLKMFIEEAEGYFSSVKYMMENGKF